MTEKREPQVKYSEGGLSWKSFRNDRQYHRSLIFKAFPEGKVIYHCSLTDFLLLLNMEPLRVYRIDTHILTGM